MTRFQQEEVDFLARRFTPRLSKGPAGLEGVAETGAGPDLSHQAIVDRWARSKAFLIQFIKTELADDAALLDLAERVLQEGREGLELIGRHRDTTDAPVDRIAAGLEVIVQTDGSRPAFLVREDGIVPGSSPDGSWTELLTDVTREDALRDVLRSVGRVDITHPLFPYAGTGWLIAHDLIATNRHVAQLFVDFAPPQPRLKTELDPRIDFGHEYRGRASVNRRPITALVFAGAKPVPTQGIDHSVLDLAVFRIGPADAQPARPQLPLSLHLGPHTADPQTEVFIAGYPGRPDPAALGSVSETDKVLKLLFDKLWGFKRLAPGIITPPTVGPRTLNHDASTLGGNSGSLIMALDRIPAVAGIHYGGNWGSDRANWGHVIAAIMDEQGLPGLDYDSLAVLCDREGIVPGLA